jgi:hypoxanthine phosphoribosyltransferase
MAMSDLKEIARIESEADLLHTQKQVEQAIQRVADELNAAYAKRNPIILTVLNGGIPFAGQLLTKLRFPLELDSIQATRYRGQTSGGGLHWLHEPSTALSGRSVLIVDDILDEGITLAEIVAYCRHHGASDVATVVLVDKDIGRNRPCEADFAALKTANRYLFGYGMDYKHYLRNAAGIYACKEA